MGQLVGQRTRTFNYVEEGSLLQEIIFFVILSWNFALCTTRALAKGGVMHKYMMYCTMQDITKFYGAI